MRVVRAGPADTTVEFTADEVRALNNALNEVCNGPDAIEDWEFSMRMGIGHDDAEALLAEMKSAIRR